MSDDEIASQLYWASWNGRDREVLELLQRGAPPNSDYYTRVQYGLTPLNRACTDNHLRSAELLIKFGAIVAATDNDGWTPLHSTCFYNRKDATKLLLEHHCPTDIKNSDGRTAADMARGQSYDDLADYVEGFQPRPRDPLFLYPTLEQLSQLECDQCLQLGVRLGLGNDQLETIKKSQHPTAATLWAAKIKNINMQWKDVVDALVSIGEGESALSASALYGWLDWVKRLVETVGLNPKGTVNKAGDTPLSLAYKKRQLEIIKYLAQEHQCDPKFPVNEAGDTPLSLECSRGNLEMVKALINKHVDPKKPVNKAGDTPLSLAYKGGHWTMMKYLAITHHCDTKGVLLLAVKQEQDSTVEFILAECHSDPNVTDKEGKTPLDLSNDPKIIKLLLKHGTKAANVYKKHSKLIGKLSSERPPHLPLSVLIIGDGGVGKSTLLKSILRPRGFWSKLQKAKPVDGVDAKTVGIIPYEIYTKEFGRIIYFDFAGQKEFYTSHCAILENAVQTSPPIIILCAKLVESEQAIIDSMYRWLTLVQNQCTNLKGKAHVIVVGSHADQVKEIGEDPQAKESIVAPIIKQFPKFEFKEFIPMDCRFADSNGMTKARKLIQKSSAILRSPETISLNAHTFYIYLTESFKDDFALSLGNVYERINSDLNMDLSQRTQDILSFIPSTIPHLVEICDQLHKRGLLLFLRNDNSPEKSFLVIDQAMLLSKVTGTVFAPESFRQHCKLASSTGVVPLSKFKKEFDGFDIEMLIAYMSHLELCFEILDEQVLDFISKEVASSTDRDTSVPESDTRYLFFPGLIRIETPEQVWEESQSIQYHFGWILQTSQDTAFFDPRCLQVLILRIVFTFRLAPASKVFHNLPSLQRFCSIWKSGICWCNDDGITAHLELAENGRSLALKMRSDTVRPEGLIHRSRIMSTIRETVESFGRNVNVIESVIDPDEVVKHPLKNPFDLPLVNIKDISAAVSSNRGTIKSTQQDSLTFEHLLQFEPYASLDQTTIQCIHSDKNAKKDEKISRFFISYFASQITDTDSENHDQVVRNSRMYRRILSPFSVNIQSVSPRQEVVQALETWRSETEGTYSCLRETLNKYSIFTGRNPLDLAGMAHDDIDPSVFSDEQMDHDTSREEHQIPFTSTSILGSQFVISIQPKDLCCKPGEQAELTVSTTPYASTYQWFFENQAISLPDYKRQTSERLLISKFLPKHKGVYWCVVEDASGTRITSRHATLTAEGEKIEKQELEFIGKMLEKSAIDFGKYGIETGESDVTYEEMEFIMKLNPRTKVLSINLKQEIMSRLKEEQLYAKAIKEKVSLTYTKILALGPGQVGKSTFVRRLLGIMEGNIQTSPLETQPQSSTGITEMKEACIRYTRVTGAITNKKQWHVLKHDLHDQLNGLMSLIVKQSQQRPRHGTTGTIQSSRQIVKKIETVVDELLVNTAVQVKMDEKHPEILPPSNESIKIQTLESPVTKKPITTKQIQTFKLPSRGPIASALLPKESDIDKTIREFKELKQECRLSPDRMEFEMLFNVADVGGQPAFLEMLPSLTIGPALYLVFMNLKQELGSRYPVPFKCKDSTMNLCKDYSYTSEEVLFSALSSIACFGHPNEDVETYIQKPEAGDKEQKNSLALLVGTFLDKVNDKEIQLTNQQLKKRLEDTSFYKEGLILSNSFSLLVNNMSAEVSEIEGHRKKLEAILTAKFRKYQIPTQWLMLSICLKLLARNQNKYHVSFADCVKLGVYFDMDEEMVSVALQFLHKYIGLVMYFPHHENLKKIVVCDPQVVFSTISEFIFNIYDHNKFQVSQAQYDRFVETGCFSPQDITLTNDKDVPVNEEKDKLLPIDTLVDLLVHLNIAAKVPSSSAMVLYFLPAVLQTAETYVVKRKQRGENEELLPEPICIRFKTGYIPLGFMCALIANLTAEKNVDILFDENNKLYKNMIHFRFQSIFNVTVISVPRYCEFRVIRQLPDDDAIEFWSNKGCPFIMETVRTVANKVIQSMQHGLRLIDNDSKMYEVAFHCPCPIHSDAEFGQESLAELVSDLSDNQHISDSDRYIPDKAICTTCKAAIRLTPEMMVWLGKAPSISLSICEQPARKGNIIRIRANGVRPLTYQWYSRGDKLCDADDQDYDGYATDNLLIMDSNLLSEGVFKCQVKDKFGNCVESDELDLFEDVLRRTWKLEKSEISKLKDNGFLRIRDLEGLKLNKLDFNMGEKERIKPLLASVQTKSDNSSGIFAERNPLDLAGLAHDDIDPSVFSIRGDEQMDPGTTSLHELIVKHGVTDEQLDREIKQDDLAPVAMHFDAVELYLNPLKLTDNEQADVKRDAFVKGNQVAVITCLSIWRGHEPSEATFGALIKILLDLRKEELATKICQYIYLTLREEHQIPSTSTSEPPAHRVTLQELIKRYSLTDEQLNSEIEDSDTPKLALCFDNVELYSSSMGLAVVKQADVKESRRIYDTQAAMMKCLQIWKQHNPYQATYRGLLDIVLGVGKGDTAHQICQQLTPPSGGFSRFAKRNEKSTATKHYGSESKPPLPGDVGESVVEVTNKSNEFSNFGIKITVLENSLPKGIDMCVLHISFELSTDFEIPANSELVSSIYRVKCEPQVQFKKPVTLEIQHCASLSSDHQQRLVFARATYQSKKFEILEGDHFPIGERYGSIQLTRFSRLGVFIRKVFGFPIEKIYSALLFRNNLRCDVIDTKCVICQDLDTHVKVIREALERDGFTKEMDLDQIQFENAVEMELHSENPELWTVTRVTSTTLSRDRIEGYSRVLDSNSRRGVIPAIHYRFKLKEKNISDSVNFLLMKTDLDEESHHLILHIDLPQTPGTSDSATQRGSEHPRNLTRQSSSTPIVLTEDDIRSICEKLKSASKDWFNLGLTLGVKFTDLKDIEDEYRNNKRCLTEMVGKCLEVTDPEHPMTWPYICECLRSATVERNDVAEEIEGGVRSVCVVTGSDSCMN